MPEIIAGFAGFHLVPTQKNASVVSELPPGTLGDGLACIRIQQLKERFIGVMKPFLGAGVEGHLILAYDLCVPMNRQML